MTAPDRHLAEALRLTPLDATSRPVQHGDVLTPTAPVTVLIAAHPDHPSPAHVTLTLTVDLTTTPDADLERTIVELHQAAAAAPDLGIEAQLPTGAPDRWGYLVAPWATDISLDLDTPTPGQLTVLTARTRADSPLRRAQDPDGQPVHTRFSLTDTPPLTP
ncbi:hypothetical protein ACFU0X_20645 [Streptomyces cellulosae]|uniref:Uncharacterized protein n=1 Tax=Streptomyces cellulosae TaxID=1968 RepID=A0ABW6JJ57_STRCE